LSKPAPLAAIANREQDRVRMLTDAGPTVLLGTTALGYTKTQQSARAVLRDDFGFNPARAQSALRAASDVFAGTTAYPIDALAGMPLASGLRALLRRLLPGEAQDAGAAPKRVSLEALRRHADYHSVDQMARAAVQSKDGPSMLVVAALLASLGPQVDQFTSLLQSGLGYGFAMPNYRGRQQTIDRVLSAAFALDSARQQGILLGQRRSFPNTTSTWRFRAAPWVLATVEPDTPTALRELLAAIHYRNLTFVLPGEDPFPYSASSGDVSLAQDMGVSAAAKLTKWFDRPMWFAGPKGTPQILLTQDNDFAYAWVGRSRRGVLVAFDTENFTTYTLDEAGTNFAKAVAIGWYIDLSISLRKAPTGTTTIKRSAGGTRISGASYRPTAAYLQQRHQIVSGQTDPPLPHVVAAFIRHLGPNQRPNPEHVAEAPKRLRKLMGRHDTWVRSHTRGGAVEIDYAVHLTSASALGDILGTIERSATG
jgi:hypothetical protein